MDYDQSISCENIYQYTKSLRVIIVALFLIVCDFLPALLLVLYPIKAFRACLSKCKLDRLALTTFVDKFHGCYRNGLDGGRDMRSFSGLYFFLRGLLCLYNVLSIEKIGISYWSYELFVLLAVTVLIAVARPYKQNYVNILDTLLLAHLSILSHLLSRKYFHGDGKQHLLTLLKLCHKIKIRLTPLYRHYNCSCWKFYAKSEGATEVGTSVKVQKQSLIGPTYSTVTIDIGSTYGGTD